MWVLCQRVDMPLLVNLDTYARRGWYPMKCSRKTLLDYLLDML